MCCYQVQRLNPLVVLVRHYEFILMTSQKRMLGQQNMNAFCWDKVHVLRANSQAINLTFWPNDIQTVTLSVACLLDYCQAEAPRKLNVELQQVGRYERIVLLTSFHVQQLIWQQEGFNMTTCITNSRLQQVQWSLQMSLLQSLVVHLCHLAWVGRLETLELPQDHWSSRA